MQHFSWGFRPLSLCFPFITLSSNSRSNQHFSSYSFSSVQFSHWVMSNFLRPHGLQHARLPCPSPTLRAYSNSCPQSRSMPSNHLILCGPLLLLPLIFPSIRVFSNESVLCIRWPKYWSFSICPSNEYSGLISFRLDWVELLADALVFLNCFLVLVHIP